MNIADAAVHRIMCWQVAQAGKRLSTSDPDKLRPRPPTLAWFDMMRFVWRGTIAIEARGFEFNLAACKDLAIGERTSTLR